MQEHNLQEQGRHNRDFLNLQIQNHITKLFKSNLEALDFLKARYQISPQDAEECRKRILDAGNSTIRDIDNLVDVFDFYINDEKLQLALQKRRSVKKFITNSKVYVEYSKD